MAEGEQQGRKVGVQHGIVVWANFLFGLVSDRQELDLIGIMFISVVSSDHLLFDLLPAVTRDISACQCNSNS